MKKLLLLLLLVMVGCATVQQPGPSSNSAVIPQGRDFETFRSDDQICRQWANEKIGHPDANNGSILGSTTLATTLLGSASGALIGAASGSAGVGLAIGTAAGLLAGPVLGSTQAGANSQEMQRRYDIAYGQCMYSKGNNVPEMHTQPKNQCCVDHGYGRPAPRRYYYHYGQYR